MELRVKWFLSADLDVRLLAKVAEAFRRHRFTRSSDRGVIITSTRPDILTGKYIERFEEKRSITDPFGNILELPVVSYETVVFRLSNTAPHLEVINAPRSLKSFVLFLAEVSPPGLRFVEPRVDVLRWVERVSAKIGRASFTAIECSDVQVSASVAANMAFYGDGDLNRDVKKFLGQRPFSLERVNVTFLSGNQEKPCSFDRAGRVRIPAGDDELQDCIRKILVELA